MRTAVSKLLLHEVGMLKKSSRPSRLNKTETLQQVRVTESLYASVMKCIELSQMNYADWMRHVVSHAVMNQCNQQKQEQIK